MSPLPFSLTWLFLPKNKSHVYNYTKILTSLRTALNKQDKRITSLLPFSITLLIDSVKRKEHSLLHLPEKAVTLVFEAKQTLIKIVMNCILH